ncbi:glycosyltransferase family 10 domain-containing protein [Bacteroides congonensis]|uniref:glycosyltransferase family 10 domain-containing protein n=1 Tax=Bacteroides congonensis TaxID=1871006 RepID=UPI0026758A5A|nr:glycosyltransferase family 10 [Bacteroides congonensis]
MKKIKVKFVDFFDGFNITANEFFDILKLRYDVEICDVPDYVIYSGFGYEHLKYDCIRIFFTGECQTPDFNECDYAIGFDRLKFGDRYARIPLYNMMQYKSEYKSLLNRKSIISDDIKGRDFCSFVVSNCFADDIRAVFYEKLSQYKHVASGGRYKNNIGGSVKDKKAFLSKYKFNIAFENCSHDGYATEKIMEAFAAGVVPIYYGDPRIAEDFNPKAFVNAHDFSSFDAMIERIKEIDSNDELYLSMLNEPIIQCDADVAELSDFLYSIFDQPLSSVKRRSHSQPAKGMEAMKLRHVFFETKIYKYYRKGMNQFARLRKGTALSSKRTK